MFKYAVKRVLLLVPIMLGISLVASLLFYIIPGDIVRVMLGQHVDPYTYANVRRSLHLDMTYWQNFVGFMQDLGRGNLGFSYIQERPVGEIILESLPVTVKLTLVGLLITVVAGIPAGILAAARDGKTAGRVINTGTVIGISLPSFLLALFLQLFLGVNLGLLPISGTSQGAVSYILPGLAIGLPLAACYARVTRVSMLEVLSRPYMLFAAARGLSGRRVILRHGLPNALVPVLTQLGMDFGMLITGVVLTETIFNLPGMGRLLYTAINTRDFPVLRGILFFIALTVVLSSLFVDLLYAKLDPRMAETMVRGGSDAA